MDVKNTNVNKDLDLYLDHFRNYFCMNSLPKDSKCTGPSHMAEWSKTLLLTLALSHHCQGSNSLAGSCDKDDGYLCLVDGFGWLLWCRPPFTFG